MLKKSLLLMLLMALFAPFAMHAQSLFSEDFEGGSMPDGWTTSGSGTWSVGTGDYSSGTGAGHGSYNAKITHGTSGAATKLITPEIDLSSVTNADLSFMYVMRSWSGDIDELKLYYRASPGDDWTMIADYTAAAASWTSTEISLPNLSGHYQIAFEFVDGYGYGLGIDYVNIIQGSSCTKPSGLTPSNLTDSSVTLSWTENGTATEWTLQYSKDSEFATYEEETVTTTPSVNLNRLTASTIYYVRVKSVCSSSSESIWITGSFSTTATPEAVGDAWSDNFEGTSCGWGLVNGTLTNVWAWGTATNNGGTHSLYVSNDNGTTNAYTNSSLSVVYATKLLTFTNGKFEFMYDWMANGESSWDYLRVWLAPSTFTFTPGQLPNGATSSFSSYASYTPEGWISLDGGGKLNLSTEWQSKSVTVDVEAGTYYLVYMWCDDTSSGSQPPAAIDNVSITKIACDYDVTELLVSNITTDEATISWNGGEASQWQVAIKVGTDEWENFPQIQTSTTLRLTGLTDATIYQVKVRAYCGGDDYGAWSDVYTFATECNPIPALGYEENFDDYSVPSAYTPSTQVLPTCWKHINTTTSATYQVYPTIYYYSYTNYAHSTPNSLRFYSYYSSTADPQPQYAILPVMSDLGGKMVTLWAKGYNNTSTIKIGTMSNPTDATTFTEIEEQALTTTYTQFEYIIPATCTDSYIAIMIDAADASRSTNGAYIDDVTVEIANNCKKPTGLAASEIHGHSAKLSWTENGEATAWVVAYTVDERTIEVDAPTNPFVLTDLDPETQYTVKVKPVCEVDKWSDEITFTTDVACSTPTNLTVEVTSSTATLGWSTDATSFQIRYREGAGEGVTYGFEGTLEGWTTIDADGDGYNWMLASDLMSGYTAHTGDDMISSQSYSFDDGALTPDNYIVSPQITLGGKISFWACAQDAAYPQEHFGVAVSTTGNTSGDDFTTIQQWTMTSKGSGAKSSNTRSGNRVMGTWYEYTVDLGEYSGQGYVAIRHFNCTDKFYLDVDDVTLFAPNTNEWTVVNTNNNPYTIERLEENTEYEVQVRANCGSEGYSEWLVGSFKTNPSCMIPTDLVVSNIGKRSADLVWTSNGDEDSWQISLAYDETEDIIDVRTLPTTENPYNLTALTPSTRYTVKVRAVCSDELQSDWSTEAVFTTLVACPAPTSLAVADITPNSAVASWEYDGEGDIELQYGMDPWKYYDNGVYDGGIGTGGGSDVYWAIMLPASMLGSDPLTAVAVYEANGYNNEPITIMVYSGGDFEPGTLLYEETVATEHANDFHYITLAESVSFDATENLWIVCKEYGTYPAQGCDNTGDPNGRWISLDGEEWEDVTIYELEYTWMIRAAFGATSIEWTTITDATSPQPMENLASESNYSVRVRAICGGEDGESDWVTYNFLTLSECTTPWDFAVDEESITASTATLSWDGFSDSYDVAYAYSVIENPVYAENFEDGEIPSDWDNTSDYPWTVEDGGTFKYIKSSNAGVSSSTSEISFTKTLESDMYITFDAECRGEGTSTFWDACTFYIDGTAKMQHGADVTDDGFLHYAFAVTAGEHTFTWNYTKDSSVNKDGDYFAVTNIEIGELEVITNTITVSGNTVTLTGLRPETEYYAQVKGTGCAEFQWSDVVTFTTLESTGLPLSLAAGINWVSFNVETTLDDLKAALVEALPGTAITIQSQTQKATYNPSNGRWTGQLRSIDVAKMYKIKVTDPCEALLQGDLVDPTEHPLTITPGANWIAYELDAANTPAAVFGGFAVPGDYVKSQTQKKQYNANGRWTGQLNSLEPGQGYIYNSASSETRPFSYATDKGSKSSATPKATMNLLGSSKVKVHKEGLKATH